jgi:hypothetical protein
VPDSCSCGARLPDDARFCHKCGKPQRDEPVFDEPVEVSTPLVADAIPEAIVQPTSITLGNRAAVKTSLLAGFLAYVLSGPLGSLGLLALVAGGAFAAWHYRRSTGQPVSMRSGARLGWITGVFLFVLLLVTFTASVALEPNFFEQMQKQVVERAALPPEDVQQVMTLIRTPVGIAAILLAMFLSATLPPMLGGAVGAKLWGRSRTSDQPHA